MNYRTRNGTQFQLFGLILTFSVIALYGCNNAQSPQPAKAESATPKWQVSLTITGGIAGESRSISINHQGVAQFLDHIKKIRKNGQIPINNLNKLAELVKNYSELTRPDSMRSNTCRDCFSYTINAKYNGNVNRQQLNDLNMDENSRRLIGALKTISSTHATN